MKNTGNFFVLRYSLVEESQGSTVCVPVPTPKGTAVIVSLLGDREFDRYNVRYAFVGFSKTEPTDLYRFQDGRYMVGKVAKLRTAHVGEKIPGDIVAHEKDDWVPLVAVFDMHEQYIFVQRDWKFGTESQIANAIQSGLRDPVLEKYNHRIFVELKTKTIEFWSIVKKHKKIYKIEIKLISPNILRTNEKAREALKELKKLYGQDEITLALENESGDLVIPQEPIADYIDYASEGEGRWVLITEGTRGGKKKHTSEKAAVLVELPVPTQDEVHHEGQLELETGLPAPGREVIDAGLVAQVMTVAENLSRDDKND
ncbi:hypothetical protein LZ24_02507 [Desulfobotulus alkaliphilus]|uniref:Uncharacterized protein n=1 Tax=Desulfobotulus alkaliphilus TaxID=622671 RepID=A0A562RHJ0_9BACT|nr:hypothetical protein [Desulfobotulus alkaliphilus]TWI68535.1 hypothetical protein LZ24_02507 [Desulfobotulus alkaliphilus]